MAASISNSATIGGGVYGCPSAPSRPLFTLKFNKQNELSMKNHRHHRHHHHHHHNHQQLVVSQNQRANMKLIMASSSSSSSKYVYAQNQPSEEGKLKTLLSLLNPLNIFLVVILRDEDGLIREKFDPIIVNHGNRPNSERSLRDSLKFLLENVDRIFSSGSLVCSSDLQMYGNIFKLDKHNECFTEQKVAEDDMIFTEVTLFLATYDEISDKDIHTLEEFKAFLQKLQSIKGNRLVSAMPCRCRKVYLNRINNTSKHYSHLSTPIRTNIAANIIEYAAQLVKMWSLELARLFGLK